MGSCAMASARSRISRGASSVAGLRMWAGSLMVVSPGVGWMCFLEKHAPCQEIVVFSKHAVTHCNFKTWEMLLAACREPGVEKTQHLLWPIFANPDRSPLYGNVAASVPGVFFRHIG